MLTGRRALVTGSAQGIGAGIVSALRQAGAEVTGLDRRAGDAQIACDLGDMAQIGPAVALAAQRMGGIDILVNNAAINEKRALAEIDPGHIERMLAVNLRAPILLTQAVLPHMGQGGRIVMIASELAYLGRANAALYTATKGGLLALTRSLARELSPGILVNAVAPGPTDTPLLNWEGLPPERRAEEMRNPMGRIATVEEVALTVAFLCGPGGDFYTGQCLGPNGGSAMF